MKSAKVFLWKTRIGAVSIADNSLFCTFKCDSDFLKSDEYYWE